MSEYIYGRQPVREVLRARRRPVKAVLLAEGIKSAPTLHDIVRLAQEARVPVRQVAKHHLNQIGKHHQGVAAQVGPYPYVDFGQALASLAQRPTPLVLAMDCVQDPQNFGSLMRTAEAVQVDLVVMQKRRQAPVTAAVSRASAGAVEHLRVAMVVNLRRALQQLADAGIFLYGLERSPNSIVYHQADLTRASAIVVGSEGQGLRRLTRETCDILLELPMCGHVESLNAAVAGSIVLYEAVKQRTKE